MTWTAKNLNLSQVAIRERPERLPSHLRMILSLVDSRCGLQRAWLFGSRAKGDARENSDFDLAFEVADSDRWAGFVTAIQDDPPSLYKYDLVNLSEIDEGFRSAILKEGIQIYERR